MSIKLKILLLVAQLLAAALLTGCGKEDPEAEDKNISSEEHVQQAQEFIDLRRGGNAIKQLKRALQKDSANAEARFLLGKLYFENQEMTAAEKELGQARELGYDKAEVMTLLARVYLAQNRNTELQALKLEQLRAEDRGTVMALQGLSLVNSGNTGKGEQLIAEAVRFSPGNEEARLTLAGLLAKKENLVGARTQVESILTRSSDNYSALMLLGNIEFLEGNLDAAEEAYSRAMEAAVNPTEAQLKRAQLRVEKHDFELAQADADDLLARLPKSPSVHYVQATIYFEQQHYREALASLLVAEKDLERHPQALLYAGISHHHLGNHDQALNYANQFSSLQPNNVYGRRLLAMIAISRGAYDEAERILRPMIDANPNDIAALNLLSNTVLARGNTREGIELLVRVSDLQPDSAEAQGRLGAGALLAGYQGLAIRQLESALAINPGFEQAEILLVLNYVRQKNYEKGLAAARRYQRSNPGTARPLNLLGRVYLAAGQTDQARKAFLEAVALEPADTAANHSLAQLAIADGDYSKARAYYDAVLAEDEYSLPTLLKLAEMAAMQNDMVARVAYLRQAIEQHPDNVAPRVMMAQYYLDAGKPEQVDLLFSELNEEMRNHSQALIVIAQAQLAKKDYLGAKFSIEKLADRQPRSAQVHHLWALLHSGLGETAETEQALAKALAASPEYLPARLMLTRMYLAQGKADKARRQIEKLSELAPNSPDVLLLGAANASLQGYPQKAVALAEKAYENLPSTKTLLHLVTYLHLEGKFEREQQLLAGWLADHPDDTQVRMAQANVSALRQDIPTAIKQYREMLQSEQDNVIALNNLAWYLRESEPEQALGYAQRAAELDPDSAATQDTLAIVLLSNGELKKAGWAINRALEQDPTNRSVRYHRALISARAGKREAALAELESLLASEEVFPEMADAIALLKELQEGG